MSQPKSTAKSLPIAPPSDGLSPNVAALLAQAHASESLAVGLALAEQAFNLATTQNNQRDRAASSHLLCYALYRTGALARVITLGEIALPWLREESMTDAYVEVLRWIGFCACDTGDFANAIKYATECFNFAELYGDQRSRILAFCLLGACFERTGDPWQGERLLQQGLAVARALGENYPLVATLNNLAVVLTGKFYLLRDSALSMEAIDSLNASLPLAREVAERVPLLNDPYFLIFSEGNLGEILVHLGQLEEAETLLNRSLTAALAQGFHSVVSRVRCSIAEMHLARGENPAARQLLIELLANPATTQNASTLLRAYYGLYLAYRADGESSQALLALENFRRIESQRTLQQLKARSDLMVTRLEASENERKGLERAYGIVKAHESRAVALERLALEDELTGLGNRRALDLNLPGMLEAAALNRTPLAVMVLDLDHFKRVNDAFGHAIGDKVLVQIAQIVGEQTRPNDLVTRTGGEEFVLVLPGTNHQDAFDVCERLRLRVSDFPWSSLAPNLAVTVSAGIASAPAYVAATLLERADLAMYRAKKAGRNRVAVAPATDATQLS
ncbi:MAG: diguanylate cyclase [Rhizobacter sp.]|nr:diguanylate cyclase [Burkholderiales bacterium]